MQIDRGRRSRQTGAAVQVVEDVPRRLLVEEVEHVQLEPQPLVAGHREFMREQQVGLAEERRATHVAAPFDEELRLIGRRDVGGDRRAAAGVDEGADLRVLREVVRAVELAHDRTIGRQAAERRRDCRCESNI